MVARAFVPFFFLFSIKNFSRPKKKLILFPSRTHLPPHYQYAYHFISLSAIDERQQHRMWDQGWISCINQRVKSCWWDFVACSLFTREVYDGSIEFEYRVVHCFNNEKIPLNDFQLVKLSICSDLWEYIFFGNLLEMFLTIINGFCEFLLRKIGKIRSVTGASCQLSIIFHFSYSFVEVFFSSTHTVIDNWTQSDEILFFSIHKIFNIFEE